MRARELGIQIGRGVPGPNNGITDVPGVRVGYTTLVEGDGPLVVGEGPVRTGVTVVIPHDRIWQESTFAGCHRLNGNGELTGLEWIRESGLLTTPIAITNTCSVGVVRDALITAQMPRPDIYSALPVVGETWDGILNDILGMHVRIEHVHEALANATGGPIAEGNVGGGTGMICHGFKGGIGTASRLVEAYVVGVLLQANHGQRQLLRVDGLPVGRILDQSRVPLPTLIPPRGSVIVVVGTNAPLLPHQCARLAQRAGLGIARGGGAGEDWSGDLFIAFATGNRGLRSDGWSAAESASAMPLEMIPDVGLTPFFEAVVEATEEAVLNAMLQARTMIGRDSVVVHALEADLLVDVMEHYRYELKS